MKGSRETVAVPLPDPRTDRDRRPRRGVSPGPAARLALVLASAMPPLVAPVAAEPGPGWRVETGEDFMSGARTGLAVHVLTPPGRAREAALTVGCSGELPLRAMYAPGDRLGSGTVRLRYRVDADAPREVDGFPGADGTAVIVLDDALVPRLLAGRAARLRAIDARGARHDAEFPLDGLVDALTEACSWSASFRALHAATPGTDAPVGEIDLAATFAGLSAELATASTASPDPALREDTLETRAVGAGTGVGAGPEASDARTSVRRDDPPGALDRGGAVLRREVQVRLREATSRWKSRLRNAIVPHAALDPSGCAALVEVDEAGGVGAMDVEGCPEREASALRRAIEAAAPLPLPRAEHVWRPRVGLAFD